jgi:hypothetical protein
LAGSPQQPVYTTLVFHSNSVTAMPFNSKSGGLLGSLRRLDIKLNRIGFNPHCYRMYHYRFFSIPKK